MVLGLLLWDYLVGCSRSPLTSQDWSNGAGARPVRRSGVGVLRSTRHSQMQGPPVPKRRFGPVAAAVVGLTEAPSSLSPTHPVPRRVFPKRDVRAFCLSPYFLGEFFRAWAVRGCLQGLVSPPIERTGVCVSSPEAPMRRSAAP